MMCLVIESYSWCMNGHKDYNYKDIITICIIIYIHIIYNI